jgi:hypothetical protein
MTKGQKWFVVMCLGLGLLLGPFILIAQQQFSGGQAVTVSAALPTGANTIGAVTQASGPWTQNVTQFGGSAVATGTGVSGAGVPRVTVSSDSSLALAAGTAKVGIVAPQTGCGATNFESGSPVGFAALAAATTTVTSTTTCVLTLILTNTGSANFTYYVTDNQATPVSVLGSSGNPITILPGERDEYTFNNGAKFNSGIKITASATTGSFYVFGVQ